MCSIAAPVEEQVLLFRGNRCQGVFKSMPSDLGDALINMTPPAAHAAQFADEWDRSIGETERLIRDQQARIEGEARAQTVTVGTHAVRAVEAEELRTGWLITLVAMRAGVVSGEKDVLRRFNTGSVPRAARLHFH